MCGQEWIHRECLGDLSENNVLFEKFRIIFLLRTTIIIVNGLHKRLRYRKCAKKFANNYAIFAAISRNESYCSKIDLFLLMCVITEIIICSLIKFQRAFKVKREMTFHCSCILHQFAMNNGVSNFRMV